MSIIATIALLAGLQEVDPEKSVRNHSIEALQTFQAVCTEEGGDLWGVSLCGKMVIVDYRNREAVANARAPGFVSEGDYFVGRLPDTIGVANTAFDWEGEKWIMVIWPIADSEEEKRAVLMHEAFHAKQEALGFTIEEGRNEHLATKDGRLWLRLEGEALVTALTNETDSWRNDARDALAFYRQRARLFPESMDDESALILHEGLAEYSGVKLGGGEQAIAMAVDRVRDGADRESLVRSVGYVMGPAYGLLLDRSGYDWKKRAAEGAPLPLLLEAALGHNDAAFEERAAAYGYEAVLVQETAREAALEVELAILRAQLIEGPRLVLPFARMNVTFNPNRVVTLDDQGTVYRGATVTDDWGKIVADDVILISPDWSSAVVALSSDIDGSAPAGDGWNLELSEGWRAVPGERDGEWVLRQGG